MTERTIQARGARICAEAFGNPADRPVLPIMGVMASMLWWPDRFCQELADRGCHVVRYDNRDTGLSTHWPRGEPGYSSTDMIDDAVAVLDGYGIGKAHIVGMSMGGIIAQDVALRYPDRVETVTVMSSSPLGMKRLPSPTAAYQAHSADGETVDWADLEAMASYIRKDCAMLAGTRHAHDARAAAALVERDMARTGASFASATNHFILPGGDEGAPESLAANIKAPLMAIHGTSDPLFPIEHGEAFATVVPGAGLHRVEGGGHEVHDADIVEIATVIIEHIGRNR